MAEAEVDIQRILVALDSAIRGDALLEAAARLAALANAELTALFIEDTEVLQWAALPFARELDRASAALRAIEPGIVEREMQAQARRLRRCVEALRERHGIRASLRVLRGEFATAALSEAAERDIVFVSGEERRTQTFDAPGVAPVCVYFDDSPAARRALRLAGIWAGKWGRRLRILAAPHVVAEEAMPEARAPQAQVVTLAEADERSLREALARQACALLVLPRGREHLRLRRGGMLDAVSCPVVLVS